MVDAGVFFLKRGPALTTASFGLVECKSEVEEEITWLTRFEALKDAVSLIVGCGVD